MGKRKVLVVDDEVDFLKIVKLNLEETSNYEVKTLSTAKDIVSEVYSFSPDVILLDMLMPGVGGIDACVMLNNDPIGKVTPIIILSALGKVKDQYSAYNEGVVAYLVKPVKMEDLIAAIEKSLRYK